MHTPAPSREGAIVYLRIVFAAAPFMYFFMFLQMAQRGTGDSTTPFWFMALAIVIDIALNPLLIAGVGPFPRLGIAGSATSTLIGQGVSLIALIVHLYRKGSVLTLRGPELRGLRPDPAILRSLVTRGLPMGLQMLIMSSAAVVMISFVNAYGALTSAAFAISSILWSYLQMPIMAIGASASSMAAQNVGARRWDRVDAVARAAVISGLLVTGAIAALLYLLLTPILSVLLPSHSPAIPLARHINLIVLWGMVSFAVTFALSGVVRSTGAVWAPMAILAISMIGVRIPFAAALAPVWGSDSIWWSFPLGTLTAAGLSALYYRFGGWRRARMLDERPHGQAPDAGVAAPVMAEPAAARR